MIRTLLVALLALFTAAAFAAVDVNKADQAALETVKGIGPAISGKILDERKKSPFKDWADLVDRVQGIGDTNAAKFSAEGLTVNGASFKGAAPAKAGDAKKDKEDKPAKAEEPKADKKTDKKDDKKDKKADEKKPDDKAAAENKDKTAEAKASAPKVSAPKASAAKASDKK